MTANDAFRQVYLAHSKVCKLLSATPTALTLYQRERLVNVEHVLSGIEEELEAKCN